MVKTNSKRKLFNGMQEHKENEPEQLTPNNSRGLAQSKGHSGERCLRQDSSEDKKSKASGIGAHLRKETFEDVSNTHTPTRPVMPMSERQQIALLMQLSSPSPTNAPDSPLAQSPQTPILTKLGKRNERGETPLHVAAIKGDAPKINQLLEEGANVNIPDYAGWTALHEACNRGFVHIASLLIEAGADVNAKGLDNDTPLHDASINNHLKIVRILLKAGASVNSLNCRGKSPKDVCRSPFILTLFEQAEEGLLDDLSSDYSSEAMSRRTPPNNKNEEKPLPVSSSTTITTNSSLTTSNASTVSSSSNNGSGRPSSPRLAFRGSQMSRTPDKTQPRPLEKVNESEDVYEFRCSKEESQDEPPTEQPEEVSQGSPSSESKGDKRSRDGEVEEEDENKKKRRKEDVKEDVKGALRAGGRPGTSDKGSKPPRASITNPPTSKAGTFPSGSNVVSSSAPPTSNVSSTTTSNPVSTSSNASSPIEPRKSPINSAANSPKPAPISKNPSSSGDSDSEDKSDANSGAPKVPPLKIVLAPASVSEQETHVQNGKNGSNRQLPYVVNTSSVEEKDGSSSEAKDVNVKPEELVQISSVPASSSGPTSSTANTSSSTTSVTSTSNGNSITSSINGSNGNSTSGSTSEKPPRMTRSQKGGSSSSGEENVVVKQEPKEEPSAPIVPAPVSTSAPTAQEVYPRKRKIRMKEPEVEPPAPSAAEQPQQTQQITNCYEMFLKMRKQVERRRRQLFPVQPRPPEGFKSYLMNRCSYVLANNSNSTHSVPIIPPPASLSQPLKDLFTEQEKERYKLKTQHQIEQTKLVLSVEQEILRVHGRAARALASQVLPFSVCTILKDEEVYNVITLEQEEKDRNLRSRYNGRHFFSWLQEVDDKWEKIKEDMVLRHHNEAESLHAVQKMDWEWKLKELNLVDANSRPQIDEVNVPMVTVSDFNLLPA